MLSSLINKIFSYPNRINFVAYALLGFFASTINNPVVWAIYFAYSFGITFFFLRFFKRNKLSVRKKYISSSGKNAVMRILYASESVLYLISWFIVPVLTSVFLYLVFNDSQEIETGVRIAIVMISSFVLAIYFKMAEKIIKNPDKILKLEQFLVTGAGLNLFFLIMTSISFNYFTQSFIGEAPLTLMVGGVFLAFILWISLRLFRLDALMLISTVALFTFFSYLVFQENIISVELGFILTTLGFIFMTTYQKMILKDMTPEIVASYVVILVAILFIILR